MSRGRRFIEELKRRRVPTTLVAYSVASLGIAEATAIGVDAVALPLWSVTFVVTAFVLGLPVVFALAWAFDVTATDPRRAARMIDRSDPNQAQAIAALRRRMLEALDPTLLTLLRQEAELLVAANPHNLEARSLLLTLQEAEVSEGNGKPDRRTSPMPRQAAWIRHRATPLILAPLLLAGLVSVSLRPVGNSLPVSAIRQSGESDAYGVVYSLRPRWLQSDTSSTLAVYVDGERQGGPDRLRLIPVAIVRSIRRVNGVVSPGGAIFVTTTDSTPPVPPVRR